MSDRLRSHAESIGNSVGNGLGFDPITVIAIVSTLLPMLAKCFGQAPGDAKEYLLDRYDQASGKFDQRLVERCRARTRRACRRSGQSHLRPDELDTITVASLNHAIEQDAATLAAAVVDAASSPSEGDDV